MTAVLLSALDGDVIDELVWREMGLGPDALPAILAANPDVAAAPILLAGETVTVPEALVTVPGSAPPPLLTPTQLWD